MPRVLIVCDGDGTPTMCFSPSFTDSPAYTEALALLATAGDGARMQATPQSQIDRFALPGEEC